MITSQLALEVLLAKQGVGSLQLVDQVAGPEHFVSKYTELVAGCTYALSPFLEQLDVRTTHPQNHISVCVDCVFWYCSA